ncbi:MAG: hypothetical protein JWO42_3438, partial [Chloroflexi bacterium]|nr:hypothetical protein [Chloroflexota bacterium]
QNGTTFRTKFTHGKVIGLSPKRPRTIQEFRDVIGTSAIVTGDKIAIPHYTFGSLLHPISAYMVGRDPADPTLKASQFIDIKLWTWRGRVPA